MSCALMLTLGGCLEHPLVPVEYENIEEQRVPFPIAVNKDVDILFVIDDSGSMGDEQGTLAANFPAFIEVLERDGVEANYRIGVTTTDNGNLGCVGGVGGALQTSSCRTRLQDFVYAPNTDVAVDATDVACTDVCTHDDIEILPTTVEIGGDAVPRPWIESIEGETNIGGGISTAEAFQCMGPQGINGCGFESHLESMYKALKRMDTPGEASYGFVRPNSILAVVHVTDEADCSVTGEGQTIFDLDGERAFWSDPAAKQPTSAVCWNAGVACTGGSGTYDECHSENYDASGKAGVTDGEAVLHPVSRYISLLQEYEEERRRRNQDAEVLVAVISGVPEGYARGEAELTYQDGADATFMDDYGIGPGCSSAAGEAIPPVRLKEFAEEFEVDNQRNLFSVCNSDYTPALEKIAEIIGRQLKPACFPACAADTDPATETLDPLCTVTEEIPDGMGGLERNVLLECDVNDSAQAWDYPPGEDACYRLLTDTDMSDECAEAGWNLEFKIERRKRAPVGATVDAACTLSQQKDLDCPFL